MASDGPVIGPQTKFSRSFMWQINESIREDHACGPARYKCLIVYVAVTTFDLMRLFTAEWLVASHVSRFSHAGLELIS